MSVRGWNKRLARGEAGESTFQQFATRCGRRLRPGRDVTGGIQWSPDFYVEPDGVFVDPKNGCKYALERGAYETYMQIDQTTPVYVAFVESQQYARVRDIEFVSSSEYVSRFDHPHPVIDGWITPRADSVWKTEQRWDNEQASGTPYRVVNTDSLRDWAGLFSGGADVTSDTSTIDLPTFECYRCGSTSWRFDGSWWWRRCSKCNPYYRKVDQ